MRVFEVRFYCRIVKPMTVVFERSPVFREVKDATFAAPDFEYRLERTDSRVVSRQVLPLLVLGT